LATSAMKTQEVELENGETIVVRPLSIANLRKALKVFEAINEREVDGEMVAPDDPMDVYVRTLAICVERQVGEQVRESGTIKKLFSDESKSEPVAKYRDYLEENFSEPAIEDSLKVAAGIDLSVMRDFQKRMRDLALEQLGRDSTSPE
jgi:hypothetical protein